MATDWQGMAHSLIVAIMRADIPVEAKEGIMFDSLHNSPLARAGGGDDIKFSEMLISMQLRDREAAAAEREQDRYEWREGE